MQDFVIMRLLRCSIQIFYSETINTETSGVYSEADDKDDEEEEEKPLGSPLRQFLNGINPINVEEWPNMGYLGKFYEIFKVKSFVWCQTNVFQILRKQKKKKILLVKNVQKYIL